MKKKTDPQISRRNMLKKGAIAVGSGAATTLLGVGALRTADAAGPARQAAAAPAILQGAQAGRRFRAALGGARNTTIEELQLLPIGDRHVLVRTDASAPCYTLAIGGSWRNTIRRAASPECGWTGGRGTCRSWRGRWRTARGCAQGWRRRGRPRRWRGTGHREPYLYGGRGSRRLASQTCAARRPRNCGRDIGVLPVPPGTSRHVPVYIRPGTRILPAHRPAGRWHESGCPARYRRTE